MMDRLESGPEQQFRRLTSIPPKDAAAEIRGMLGQPEMGELDFTCKKDATRAELHPHDKRGFAKALSGFSNSDGGLLIWGVDARRRGNDPESPDVVTGFHPICNVHAFASSLNGLVAQATTPVAAGTESRPIIEDVDSGTGFCVTFVPVGTNPPYRADLEGLRQYYKRAASSFYPMEPYDIRDVIFRFRYPKPMIEISAGPHDNESVRQLLVRLVNRGPVSLRGFKFTLELPVGFVHTADNLDQEAGRQEGTFPYVAYSVVSLVGSVLGPRDRAARVYMPIYPNESVLLIGPTAGRPLLYKTAHSDIGHLYRRKLYWSLYGDDMPSISGEEDIFPLVSGLPDLH